MTTVQPLHDVVPEPNPLPMDLPWLLRGGIMVRPWLLLVLVSIVSVLAGANGWLVLRTRAQAAEIRVFEAVLEAPGGVRP
jgi:hypothetical protein